MTKFAARDTGAKHKRRVKSKRKSAPIKKAPRKKIVKSYSHGGSRKNLPTDQTGRTMSSKDIKPIPFKPPSTNPSKLPRDLRPPHLQWERDPPDSTPAGPLYIHEKLHPAAFAESLKKDHISGLESYFGQYDGLPEGAEFEWYKYSGNWQNRVIRGESRHVMASLLAKEGMAGKVQMIYFDPPYGINFRNILQANVNKNQDAEAMPNDPVAIQTFRDTYKNGIHSYLDNIYHIASHARELLHESGSFFLQISSANLNRIGIVLDEIFGAENRMAIIAFVKTGSSSSVGISDVADYILWYAKDKDKQSAKYHQLYEPTPTRKDMLDFMSYAALVELKDGTVRNLTPEEKIDPDRNVPDGAKLFTQIPLLSQHYSNTRSHDYEWNGKTFKCPHDNQWSVSKKGLDMLAKTDRLVGSRSLRWKKYENEIHGRKINNIWRKQESAQDMHYVVETSEKTIEKCMLMSTDPGDLVLDPTCGSGTTAYVAEKWGRRWITSDASLVAVNLARQRIITGVFSWHVLLDSEVGHRLENELRKETHQQPLPGKKTYGEDPSGGFVCERLPHVSAQFLAYPDREAPIDYMVDRPETDKNRMRVSSPFTIESLSPYRYVNPKQPTTHRSSNTYQNIVSALRNTGIRMEDSNTDLLDLEEYPGKMITHTATFDGKRACVLVAPDDCTVPPIMVDHAAEEAAAMPSVTALIIVAFAYEPSVRNERRGRLNIYKAMANHDLQSGNLKDEKDDVAFVLVGEPDVKIETDGDKMTAEVIGYDTFDPASGNTRQGTKNDVYCWMIDTAYDGRSFFARRIHFPGAEKDKQISGFFKKLQKHIDQDLWDATLSLKSAPFNIPKSGRIAVRIITSTHTEMTTVIELDSKHKRKLHKKNDR